MTQKILVVLPHPDDEAFGVAGTLIQYIKKGAHVTYACLTLGEMGRNLGSPFFTNREELPSIRKAELRDAADAIGIQDLRMLGYRDKTVEFEDIETLSADFTKIIKEVKPELVITFYPGYAVHPDHDATGAGVIHAVQALPKEERPVVHCVAFSKNAIADLGNPHIVHDVSDVLDQKIKSIQAHRSQSEGMLKLFTNGVEGAREAAIKRFGTETFWIYKF